MFWSGLVRPMQGSPRIVSVLLPQPLPEPFDYELPEGMTAPPGSFVSVPLGPRDMIGVVWGERGVPSNRKLKAVQAVFAAPQLPAHMRGFIERAARYVCSPTGLVLAMAMRSREALEDAPTETLVIATGAAPDRMTPAREKVLAHATVPLSAAELARLAGVSSGVVKGLVDQGALAQVERSLDPPFPAPDPNRPSRDLTAEQSETSAYLREMVKENAFRVALLDGVQGFACQSGGKNSGGQPGRASGQDQSKLVGAHDESPVHEFVKSYAPWRPKRGTFNKTLSLKRRGVFPAVLAGPANRRSDHRTPLRL